MKRRKLFQWLTAGIAGIFAPKAYPDFVCGLHEPVIVSADDLNALTHEEVLILWRDNFEIAPEPFAEIETEVTSQVERPWICSSVYRMDEHGNRYYEELPLKTFIDDGSEEPLPLLPTDRIWSDVFPNLPFSADFP